MTGTRLFILAGGLVAGMSFLPPQISPEVRHTSWKVFYSKIPDTVTLRFENDTAAVLTSTGVPVLQSTYKLKNDLITFHDFGGTNACTDLTGSYHVKINGDTLVLVVDEDPCDGRTGTLISKPWIRTPITAAVRQ